MTATGPRALPTERPSAMVLSPPLSIGADSPTQARQQERPWLTGQLLALAWSQCSHCLGTGGEADGQACGCVHEAIFRTCYRRYRNCQQNDPRGWNRKDQEFVADFEQITRRAVGQVDWPFFRRHFLVGALTDRVALMRSCMRRAGRALRNTQPYPLFPVHGYFGEPVHLSPKVDRTA